MRYRTKPFEIEAVHFKNKSYFGLVQDFVGERKVDENWYINNFQEAGTYARWDDEEIVAEVYDYLHSTWVGVKEGQYIIRGNKGEYYPCDADIFEAKYEAV